MIMRPRTLVCAIGLATCALQVHAEVCMFSGPATIALSGTSVLDIAIGDLDSDGDLDAVVLHFTTITTRLNDGAGVLLPGSSFTSSGSPDAVALGDIDGDKDLDIVVPSESTPEGLSTFLNQGTGTFVVGPDFPGGGIDAEDLVLIDLEPDGDPDAVLMNTGSDNLSILLNDGSGLFGSPTLIAVATDASGIASDDLNDDGLPDLAVSHDGLTDAVSILLNLGGDSFAGPVLYPAGDAPRSIALGDFDTDGDLDFATVTFAPTTIGIGLNNGDGTFAPTVVFPHGDSGATPELAAADLDGDLDADLVVVINAANYIKVWLSDGDGTFTDAGSFGGAHDGRSVALPDLNADGSPDVVTGTAAPTSIEVFLNQPPPDADLDSDCSVGPSDLAQLLAAWGPCRPNQGCPADFDGDSAVGPADLAQLLSQWGS